MNKKTKVTSFEIDKKLLSRKLNSPSFVGKPTPLDFNAFVPWICLEFQVPYDITVNNIIQEEYAKHKRHSLIKSKKAEQNLNEIAKKPLAIKASMKITKPENIPVTAYYNTKSQLMAIEIVNSPFEIPRKLIVAITLCIPFHASLGKISIKKGKINLAAIQEISKLLPHSNITQVVLENCCVSGSKYHILLENSSQLQNLTLRRMGIDDAECKNIVEKLVIGQPASKTLLTLDLSFNKLTDKAAYAFGKMLRGNRCLLHLNLCNNKISDEGADGILKSLTSFSLSNEEIDDKKRRRIEYLIKRIAFYKEHKDDLLLRQIQKYKNEIKHDQHKDDVRKQHMPSKKGNIKKNKTDPSPSSTSDLTKDKLAKNIIRDDIGEFIDVFDDENVIVLNNRQFSIGNLMLCSLNLSFNNLSYITVRKIREVLNYQVNVLPQNPRFTGLMRILFEGNDLPRYCQEYKDIYFFLDRVISENSRYPDLTHSTPTLKSNKRGSMVSIKSGGRSTSAKK